VQFQTAWVMSWTGFYLTFHPVRKVDPTTTATFVVTAMLAPKLPAMFSLFRQRGPKRFELATRYYDAEKEAREERTKRVVGKNGVDRELLAQRMRHSWQRQHTGKGQVQRYLFTLGIVAVIVFFIIKGFGLVNL